MANAIKPAQVLQAVKSLYSELPFLIDKNEWDGAKPTIENHLAELEQSANSQEAIQASMKLVQYLSRFPSVRDRIRFQLELLDFKEILGDSIDPATEKSLAFFHLDRSEEEPERKIAINKGGTGGATSRKLTNIVLDLRRLLDMFAETASGTVGAWIASNKLAILVGVLGVIRSLNKAVTVDVSEKDASVFWGLIQAHAELNAIPEATLLTIANEQRQILGLSPISPSDLRSSLLALEHLKSIEKVPGTPDHWSIVESFHVRTDDK